MWFATGGKVARVFHSGDRGSHWTVANTPIISGEPSRGIFSIAFKSEKEGIVVGGDYKNPASARDNIATTLDGGITWKLEELKNSVYFSAVTYLERNQILACGPEGAKMKGIGGAKEWKDGGMRCNAVKHVFDRAYFQIFAGPGGAVSILESLYTDQLGPEGSQ